MRLSKLTDIIIRDDSPSSMVHPCVLKLLMKDYRTYPGYNADNSILGSSSTFSNHSDSFLIDANSDSETDFMYNEDMAITFKRKLTKELLVRFKILSPEIDARKLGQLLDPRFKSLEIKSEEQKSAIISHLRSLCDSQDQPSESTIEESPRNAIEDFFQCFDEESIVGEVTKK